jgi:hypothetical protein
VEIRIVILAIDPGSEQSAYVAYANGRPVNFGKVPNDWLLQRLRDQQCLDATGVFGQSQHVTIEMIASYGMPVGSEVFDTCVWIGRFIEAWRGSYTLMFRREVKLHLCGQARAKDPNVRQALIDRFGPGREKAIGTKKQPGPLYGVSADVWSALAVAVTWSELQRKAA